MQHNINRCCSKYSENGQKIFRISYQSRLCRALYYSVFCKNPVINLKLSITLNDMITWVFLISRQTANIYTKDICRLKQTFQQYLFQCWTEHNKRCTSEIQEFYDAAIQEQHRNFLQYFFLLRHYLDVGPSINDVTIFS